MIEDTYGCHPCDLPGYSNPDRPMYSLINSAFPVTMGSQLTAAYHQAVREEKAACR